MRRSPRSSAMRPARMAPPAGPDSTRRTGKRAAVSRLARLPPEVIRWIGLAEPELGHLPLEPAQVARHQRLHVGVGDGRGGALVLARLGARLARQRHAHARANLGQDLADARLVRGIGVGVDQRHRHRLDVELGQAPGDAPHRRLVERPPHGAVHVHALGHREAQLARHQRRRLDDVDVVLVEAALVGDLDHVAEAVGGDQRGARALALDDGIGGERGAVHEHADVAEGRGRPRPARRARPRSRPPPAPAAWSAAWPRGGARPASSTMSVKVPPMSTASRAVRRFSLMIVVRLSGSATIRPYDPAARKGATLSRRGTERVGWVKRSADPTQAQGVTCVASSLTLDATYALRATAPEPPLSRRARCPGPSAPPPP